VSQLLAETTLGLEWTKYPKRFLVQLALPKKGDLKRMLSSSYFCSKCSFKHRNEWRLPTYYELPDGALVLIATTHGWCFECGDVSCEIEHFEEAATRQKQFSNLQARLAETSEGLRQIRKPSLFVLLLGNAARAKEDRLELARAAIEGQLNAAFKTERFFGLRIAPEKCLRCGSTNFVVFSVPEMSISDEMQSTPLQFKHPGCGGTLIYDFRALFVTMRPPEERKVLTLDGDLLRTDKIPRAAAVSMWKC
jgi:hypothetical protein